MRLTSLTFGDGTTVPMGEGSIAILVGPNNVGKSRALRDINAQVSVQSEPPAVVVGATVEKPLEDEELDAWLRENAHIIQRGLSEVVGRPFMGEIDIGEVKALYRAGPPFQQTGPYYVFFASTEQRLQLVGSTGAFDVMNQAPTSPLQVLYLDADLELELSASSQRAFGFPLTVNRVAGGSIHLHVGSAEGHGEPLPTNSEYRRAISKLPFLQQEGDGVRSYMGVLLSVTGANYPLVLIDEPEAFLHPPQARQLGRELTRLVGAETQLIAGTHSADFLEGVLDSSQGSVTVIRLTRDGDDVSAAVLDRAQLEEVWSDPLLRYSRLLDGLFHVGVVLCEGDSDCRFYEATLDSCLERAGQRPHDLLFTHTGGKDRLPAAIAALNAIDVPVQAVADFDVLSDEGLLKRLVDGLDGDWSALETDWRIVTSAVRQLGKAPPTLAVREDVRAALDAAEGPTLTKDVAKRIRESTKIEDAWERTKAGGLAVLPQGEAINAAERLLGALAGIGLHVVPVGELERWAPEIGGHGPAWVAGTLEAKKHEETGRHADFVQGFAGY